MKCETRAPHYEEGAPRVASGGQVAPALLRGRNFFFFKEPRPTWLRAAPPQEQVKEKSSIRVVA